jgi:hypothetical protein
MCLQVEILRTADKERVQRFYLTTDLSSHFSRRYVKWKIYFIWSSFRLTTDQLFSNFSMYQHHLEGLLKKFLSLFLSLPQGFHGRRGLGGIPIFIVLTGLGDVEAAGWGSSLRITEQNTYQDGMVIPSA